MLGRRRPECAYQLFVKATNNNLGYSCTSLAKEVLLRGFYGAQLAWWFTLFSPSRFKIYNSETFFKVCLGFVVVLNLTLFWAGFRILIKF